MFSSNTFRKQSPTDQPVTPANTNVASNSNKRKYTSTQHDNNNDDDDDEQATTAIDSDCTRILCRRYLLTRTGYKYIEIGIGIPSSMDTATVDIAIGDKKGKELLLSPNTWKELLNKDDVVLSYVSHRSNTHTPSSISIANLTVKFGVINNTNVVRLETPTISVVLTAQTVRNLYTLRHCINSMIASLNDVVHEVRLKIAQYRSLASTADLATAVAHNANFDHTDIVDCEVLAILFNVCPP